MIADPKLFDVGFAVGRLYSCTCVKTAMIMTHIIIILPHIIHLR